MSTTAYDAFAEVDRLATIASDANDDYAAARIAASAAARELPTADDYELAVARDVQFTAILVGARNAYFAARDARDAAYNAAQAGLSVTD